MLKHRLRDLLYAIAPRRAAALMTARARRHSHRLLVEWGYDALTRKVVAGVGRRVAAGPFAGMTLTETAEAEHLSPFILGVYEHELNGVWDEIFRRDYDAIVDVGAKFGYYAVGLARRYPKARVVAFDTDRWARRAVREMADANGTRNVAVRGFCTPEWLEQHSRGRAFVLSDCEGFEARLFTPGNVGSFKNATLLIETHDEQVSGVTPRLTGLFEPSHHVHVIPSTPGEREAAVPLDFLTPDERRRALSEIRGPQAWLYCVPRSAPA